MEQRSPQTRLQREMLRAAGFRPLQIWVADTRVAGFEAECMRQARLVASDGIDDDGWFDASDKTGWVT